MSFLKFSAEAKSPAGYIIMELTRPVERLLNTRFPNKSYCDSLDDIFIVFVCTTREMHTRGFYKDRKYVSHKNRYADYRLNLDYDVFLASTKEQRLNMLWCLIIDVLNMVNKKVPSLQVGDLVNDLYMCFNELYPCCIQHQT